MIRVSTRGRYALRAMVDLAQHSGNRPVSRQEIAGRQAISADYLAQIFRQMQTAGLVEGVKGPGGGYRLGHDAALITVGDIIRAAEGPVAVVHCALPCPDEGPSCSRLDHCATHQLWKQVSETLTAVLDSVTLKDLCSQAEPLAQ